MNPQQKSASMPKGNARGNFFKEAIIAQREMGPAKLPY